MNEGGTRWTARSGKGQGMKRRVSYANVTSTVAVFVALGGGAYAASKVDSGDIAKNAVKSKHIKKDNVKGSDVKESTLEGVKPLAYAHIVDGAVVPGESRGVTLEADGPIGGYCLRVAGDPENVQVTIEDALGAAVATVDPPSLPDNPCSVSAEALVLTGNLAGSVADRDFYVVLH